MKSANTKTFPGNRGTFTQIDIGVIIIGRLVLYVCGDLWIRNSLRSRFSDGRSEPMLCESLSLAWCCVPALLRWSERTNSQINNSSGPHLCRWCPPVWGRAGMRAGPGSIPVSSRAGLEPRWLPSRPEPGAHWESPYGHNALLKERRNILL